jgi:hypothetical protein
MVAEEGEPIQILFYGAALNQGNRKSFEQITMAKIQKVITIETHRQIRIRALRKPLVAWCEMCGIETLMLPPEQAAIICGATQRKIFRRIESGELHFMEASQGALFVCGNSLDNKTISIPKRQEANFGE